MNSFLNNVPWASVPTGWRIVNGGKVQVGDKHWSPELAAWLPVTVNDGRWVYDFPAVIRKEGQ